MVVLRVADSRKSAWSRGQIKAVSIPSQSFMFSSVRAQRSMLRAHIPYMHCLHTALATRHPMTAYQQPCSLMSAAACWCGHWHNIHAQIADIPSRANLLD